MPQSVLTLPPQTSSVVQARRAVRLALAEWDAERLEWTVSQLVSELATNAVIHAGTTFEVRLSLTGQHLRCEVSDTSPRNPRTRAYAADATTGRGLLLVERLATAWGVLRRVGGKTVWFELDVNVDGAGAAA